jgi:molybdate transport system ATP-binding protein
VEADGGERGAARAWTGLRVDLAVPLGAIELDVALSTAARSMAVVGPSGSGKSTLLRVLAGVERRGAGLVEVDGERWLDPDRGPLVPAWERRVGWVPQDALLFPHLSVAENLGYAGAAPGKVERVAELLRIDALLSRRPRRLSGGEAQRVALGRALLSRPRLLLLDEPFSALDRSLRVELAHTVRDWCAERALPLVLVSHDEEDAEILAQERWHLVDGRLDGQRRG